jgi:hypothetical protein
VLLLHGAPGQSFKALGHAAGKDVEELFERWCTVGRKVADIGAKGSFTPEEFRFIEDTTPVE